jgi:hypothetical protein
MNKDVRGIKKQLRRMVGQSGGNFRWDESSQDLLVAIGKFVEQNPDLNRAQAAEMLGMKSFQLDYVMAKVRKLSKSKARKAAKPKKLKLARVRIVGESAEKSQTAVGTTGSVELVLESGIRVAVKSTDQVVDLLEELERRSKRLRAAS